MTFNLNQCKSGDELRDEVGTRLWYIGKNLHYQNRYPHVIETENSVHAYSDTGCHAHGGAYIIGFAPKVVRHEMWINLFDDGSVTLFPTKQAADHYSTYPDLKRIECRHITWEAKQD